MNAKLSVKTGIELSIKKKTMLFYMYSRQVRDWVKKKRIKVMRGRKRCDGYSDGTE